MSAPGLRDEGSRAVQGSRGLGQSPGSGQPSSLPAPLPSLGDGRFTVILS